MKIRNINKIFKILAWYKTQSLSEIQFISSFFFAVTKTLKSEN